MHLLRFIEILLERNEAALHLRQTREWDLSDTHRSGPYFKGFKKTKTTKEISFKGVKAIKEWELSVLGRVKNIKEAKLY